MNNVNIKKLYDLVDERKYIELSDMLKNLLQNNKTLAFSMAEKNLYLVYDVYKENEDGEDLKNAIEAFIDWKNCPNTENKRKITLIDSILRDDVQLIFRGFNYAVKQKYRSLAIDAAVDTIFIANLIIEKPKLQDMWKQTVKLYEELLLKEKLQNVLSI